MANQKCWFVFVVFIGLFLSTDIPFRGKTAVVQGASAEDEIRFINQLVKRTHRNVRPVMNISDPVNITFDITFHGVIEMDEKHQILTTDIWVRQEWTNHLIKWKPEDYGGLKQVVVDSSLVWLPDIVLYNNVFEEFDGRMDNVQTRVRITQDGHCYWAAPFIFKTSCHIDVSDFPFDKQQCRLKFGSWQHDGFELDLLRKNDYAPLAKERVENGEWNVTSIGIKKNVQFYACCPNQPYPDITFTINLKRRSLFYTYNLIIPNFLIALLAFYSFCIPVECGERISFVITVLLSMTVFLLLVAESIPPTSEAVPVIGMYYTSSIIEVALALVATGISLKVYYSYLYGPGISPVVRRFLFHRLAPILCFDTMMVNGCYRYKDKARNPFNFLKRIKTRTPSSSDITMYDVSDNKSKVIEGFDNNLDKNDAKLLSVECNGKTNSGSVIGLAAESHDHLSDQEIRHRGNKDCFSSDLKIMSSAVKDQKESDKLASECRIAAAIVDRAFMALFVVVFVCSTVIILLLPWIRKR